MSANKGKIKELVVAAIDFGTTYSGYVYAFRDDFYQDHSKIYGESWSDGSNMTTGKMPTAILFTPDGTFKSFGYTAESDYTNLAEEDEHAGWRFFSRFKMELFQRKTRLKLTTNLRDDQGRLMKALTVFSEAIRYLKDHLLERLTNRCGCGVVGISDIRWVLTVPAIWDDAAKQFMCEAAKEAGLPLKQFTLAYEPEAAALYSKEMHVMKAQEEMTTFKSGTKFMILDLGGGTVDITAHEVTPDDNLKALCAPSGGPWGGTLVDKHFNTFLQELFGQAVMLELGKECLADKLDLDRIFEMKKRMVKPKAEGKVEGTKPSYEYIQVPQSVLSDLIAKQNPGKTFEETVDKSKFHEKVKLNRGKIGIASSLVRDMFAESADKILQHVRDLLAGTELHGVKNLVMVGGFSESSIIYSAIKSAFPNLEVIRPPDGAMAILKGAVMYGFNNAVICSRKMPHSYGISIAVPFDRTVHPMLHRKHLSNGVDKCEDVFKAFVSQGDMVVPGKTTFSHSFYPPSDGGGYAPVEIYRSNKRNVKFTTDFGCSRIGELRLNLENVAFKRGERPLIDISMAFGSTTITVEAKEHGTSNKVHVELKLI